MENNEKNVKIGEYHEKMFSNILDDHGIPYLYIDQSPKVEHHSIALKGSKTKRPDFLVYLPTIGHIFIDVKARYKIEDREKSNNSKFYLLEGEINSIFSLQSYLLLPIWIAFVSRNKNDDRNFYLIPISTLKIYKDRLKEELHEQKKLLDYLFIRIPNSFLKNMLDINNLISVNNSYDFSNVKTEANEFIKIDTKIKEIINEIKNEDISEYIKNECINYIKIYEVMESKKSNGI